MRRREFVTLVGSAVAWPFGVRAQQSAMPVIGILSNPARNAMTEPFAAFRRALNEAPAGSGCDFLRRPIWPPLKCLLLTQSGHERPAFDLRHTLGPLRFGAGCQCDNPIEIVRV